MVSTFTNGIALGLWILAGLAFLTSALLPGSAVGHALGPLLLAGAIGWTALTSSVRGSERASVQETRTPRFRWWLLLLFGVLLAVGISLTIIRTGDQRSFLFAGFAALCAVVLGWQLQSQHRDASLGPKKNDEMRSAGASTEGDV